MPIFFTSDNHFHHHRIIEYCRRPFRDVEEMNATMIKRWNARVNPGDTVYHLGDFAMGPYEKREPLRKMLNGRIVLIRGNHDRSIKQMLELGFDEVHDSLLIPARGGTPTLFMRHRPPGGEWYRNPPHADFKFGMGVFLCGHVHEAWSHRGDRIINVGVDVRDFEPKTIGELLECTSK